MVAPNHTGFGVPERELHQLLRGMLEGFADTQVSPVSMLQYTLIASFRLPSLGSTQYSPTAHSEMRDNSEDEFTLTVKVIFVNFFDCGLLTAFLHGIALPDVLAGSRRMKTAPVCVFYAVQLTAQSLQ